MSECGICIEGFNATRRKRVTCPYCPEDAMACCTACVKAYLLQDDAQTPRCPSCRSGWTEDFLTQTFAKTWLLKEYKVHREQVLLDMERARLPEAQEDAARYRRALLICQEVEARIAPVQERMAQLLQVEAERATYEAYMDARTARIQHQRDTRGDAGAHREAESAAWRANWDARQALAAAQAPFRQQIHAMKTAAYREALQLRTLFGQVQQRPVRATTEEARNRWTFVMKCPAEACQGFVGTNWKCGLCEVEFCKECGDTKAAPEGQQHICNPDVLATHQALRKEAKPCPKCAAMISKIDGCDQMWCTQCQTAFSWRTGAIETSHVHNPHYFQWMRQNGAAVVARPVGDCLNLTPNELMDQVLHYGRMRRSLSIPEWIRCVRHYMQVQRGRQRLLEIKQTDEWRRRLRVKRLVNEITDAQWKDRLQRGEKAAQKEYAVLQVLELFTQAAVDLLRTTLPEGADIPNIEKELQSLRKFCNNEFGRIRTRYNNAAEYIVNPTRFLEMRDELEQGIALMEAAIAEAQEPGPMLEV